jgi:hypothetical protein
MVRMSLKMKITGKKFDFTKKIVTANKIEYKGYIQYNGKSHNFLMTKYTNGEPSFEPKNLLPVLKGAIQYLIRTKESLDYNNLNTNEAVARLRTVPRFQLKKLNNL